MTEQPEQEAVARVSPLAQAATGLSLCLDPPLASSSWILLRGSVQAPAKPSRVWPFGRRTRADSHLFGAMLQVRLPDDEGSRPLKLGPGGEFEARFAVNLPPLRGAKRQVHLTLDHALQRVELCAPVFAPGYGATLGLIVLADARDAMRIALSEPSRELVRMLSAAGPRPEGNPVFYFGLPQNGHSIAALCRAADWPNGLPLASRNGQSPPSAAVEQALWLERLTELYANELDFVVIADTGAASTAVLQAICRLKLRTEGLRAVLLSDTRPVARGVLRQSDRPGGIDRLDLPIVLCSTLDDARRAATQCGLLHAGSSAASPHHAVPGVSVARARVTSHPIVFCHGMLGYSVLKLEWVSLENYFRGLREFLTDRGFRVLMPQLGRTHGIAQRAEQLRQLIGRWTAEPVNIIAHSMGGLDARYLISKLDMADRVASLTTIATPHHGTYLGDWFVERFDNKLPFLRSLERFGVEVDGFRNVTRAACREFNRQVADSPKVRYFSYSAFQVARKIPPDLRRSHSLIARMEGANDGLVSEASARWGEHKARLRADHLSLIGEPGPEYFDHLALYLRIVEDLIRMGF
jgi:triacylglycerol lipase